MSHVTREFVKNLAATVVMSGIVLLFAGPTLGIGLLAGGALLAMALWHSRSKRREVTDNAAVGSRSDSSTQGISWIGSEGRIVRPKVRGYEKGIVVRDSSNVVVEDPDIRS